MLTQSDIDWILEAPETRCPRLLKAIKEPTSEATAEEIGRIIQEALQEVAARLAEPSDYAKDRAPLYLFENE